MGANAVVNVDNVEQTRRAEPFPCVATEAVTVTFIREGIRQELCINACIYLLVILHIST